MIDAGYTGVSKSLPVGVHSLIRETDTLKVILISSGDMIDKVEDKSGFKGTESSPGVRKGLSEGVQVTLSLEM